MISQIIDLDTIYENYHGNAIDIFGYHYYAENGLPIGIYEVTENAASHHGGARRSTILTGAIAQRGELYAST